MTIPKGLKQLGFKPEIDFICQNDGEGKGDYIKEWLSKSAQPSDSEITTAANTFDTNYTNNKYQRDRATAYPLIQDQLDMQYWDQGNGTTKWKEAIAKIKADNPKP